MARFRWIFAAAGCMIYFGIISPAAAQPGSTTAIQEGTSAQRGAPAPPDVATPPHGAIRTASGIAMETLLPGSGTDHPKGDDCVILSFTAWRRDGSLFSTSGPHDETTVQCLTSTIPGISEVLQLMAAGEKRRLWVPAELAFATHFAHHGMKKMDKSNDSKPQKVDLTFDLEVVRILKAPPTPDNLKTPPLKALRTPSGVALEMLRPGTGTKHPGMNDRVTLDYSGWTSDGKLFESTIMSGHPASFLLGAVLPGWRDVLPLLVIGEKVRVWIPAALAYGEKPMDPMAPVGNLVYDIELLEFR